MFGANMSHALQHLKRDMSLFKLNRKMAVDLRDPAFMVEEGDYVIAAAAPAQLKEIEALHLRVFGSPLPDWMAWVYKIRIGQLVTVALKGDVIAGYDAFIFNPGEADDLILHEPFVGVDPVFQGRGVGAMLRKRASQSYEHGRLKGLSTVAPYDDIKALRSAQNAGFAILKASAKPPGHYLLKPLTPRKF